MTPAKALEILTEHNKWRRGEGKYSEMGCGFPHTAKNIGEAIDLAVLILTERSNKQ